MYYGNFRSACYQLDSDLKSAYAKAISKSMDRKLSYCKIEIDEMNKYIQESNMKIIELHATLDALKKQSFKDRVLHFLLG